MKIFGIIASVITLLLLLITGCGGSTADPADSQAARTSSQVQEEETMYIGILPLRNPTEMLERFELLEQYLIEETGLNLKLRLYPTAGPVGGYTQIVREITEGEIQFAFLAPVTAVQAHENGPVKPFVCAQKEGSPVYYGHIVVRVDSPYQKIEDLEGKPVCGTSASSTSGNLMPTAFLMSKGIEKTEYFEPFEFLGAHDKAAEAVLSGKMEAAFINEMTFDKYNRDKKQLRSIYRHPAVAEFNFNVNTEIVADEDFQKVREALLRMHESDLEGITAIEPKYEKWVAVDWEDYLGIKEAIDEVHGPIFYDLDDWQG